MSNYSFSSKYVSFILLLNEETEIYYMISLAGAYIFINIDS